MTDLPPRDAAPFAGLRRTVRSYGFTLSLMAALSLFAWLSGSHVSQLTAAWLEQVGFAPRDLALDGVDRLFLSALVTHGGWTFWRVIGMVALMVGACEHRTGFRHTAAWFWGGHVAVLFLLAAGLRTQMLITGTTLAGALPLPRDVGPSAGAFTCLGVFVATLPPAWRHKVIALVLVALIAALALPPLSAVPPAADLLADLAHLLAFALGLGLAVRLFAGQAQNV